MYDISDDLMHQIRGKFANVSNCPLIGKRTFFENAGGALTLKNVVDISAEYAGIPDNQGRDNPMSHKLVEVITKAKENVRLLLNAKEGQVIMGESGTELLFRIIGSAVMAAPNGANVISSTLEHPASMSAASRWAKIAGIKHKTIKHDDNLGSVLADGYGRVVDKSTCVATVIHTSPVTGMRVDLESVTKAIRSVSPACFIIVDGIQHAAHGHFDVSAYDVDAYVISPYKMFSRHGYGLAWMSDRLAKVPHNALAGGPELNWELGTRDTGAYATISSVVEYLQWLGKEVSGSNNARECLEAAGKAIHTYEKRLTDAVVFGIGNIKGLSAYADISIIGGADNLRREGLVSFVSKKIESKDIVRELEIRGIRTHVRKNDYYSGNILKPLELEICVRVSFCHYNSIAEVTEFLLAMNNIMKN